MEDSMVIGEEVKKVIGESAFLALVTVCPDGTPHPIVAGKGTVRDDTIVFGIYKMEQTQKNLRHNNKAQVLGAMMNGGPLGFRLSGTAAIAENAARKELVFTVEGVDRLI
jgi:predicted pyridoxine 5'-phosphate oxidase superfamily flavin-nucleotide-binding protein